MTIYKEANNIADHDDFDDWSTATGCEVCGDPNHTQYYGQRMCASCIKMEETTDWDEHARKQRKGISERNEY